MPSGSLEVLLISADGIKNTDLFGKSDPYAVVTCWRHSFQSNVAKGEGSRPIWNQKFFFTVDESTSDIFIKLYDKDRFKADDFIGSARIPLTKVLKEGCQGPTAYDVILANGKPMGQVKLSMNFFPQPQNTLTVLREIVTNASKSISNDEKVNDDAEVVKYNNHGKAKGTFKMGLEFSPKVLWGH